MEKRDLRVIMMLGIPGSGKSTLAYTTAALAIGEERNKRMQCEFSRGELVTLELAVMDRIALTKNVLHTGRGDRKMLDDKIRRLEALQAKLDALIDPPTVKEEKE